MLEIGAIKLKNEQDIIISWKNEKTAIASIIFIVYNYQVYI